MRFRLRASGFKKTQRAARKAARQVERATRQGLYEWAEQVLDNSKDRVPVESGGLRDSAYLEEPRETGEFYMGYGAPHAVVQHEKLELAHPNGGEAKFLERAVWAVQNVAERFIARVAKRGLKRRVKLGGGKYPAAPRR